MRYLKVVDLHTDPDSYRYEPEALALQSPGRSLQTKWNNPADKQLTYLVLVSAPKRKHSFHRLLYKVWSTTRPSLSHSQLSTHDTHRPTSTNPTPTHRINVFSQSPSHRLDGTGNRRSVNHYPNSSWIISNHSCRTSERIRRLPCCRSTPRTRLWRTRNRSRRSETQPRTRCFTKAPPGQYSGRRSSTGHGGRPCL